jgi:hypothetical protein
LDSYSTYGTYGLDACKGGISFALDGYGAYGTYGLDACYIDKSISPSVDLHRAYGTYGLDACKGGNCYALDSYGAYGTYGFDACYINGDRYSRKCREGSGRERREAEHRVTPPFLSAVYLIPALMPTGQSPSQTHTQRLLCASISATVSGVSFAPS